MRQQACPKLLSQLGQHSLQPATLRLSARPAAVDGREMPLLRRVEAKPKRGAVKSFRLYLLRHAHAAWPSPGKRDFDRPLDERGRREARDVALQAFAAGIRPDRILSSPATRCAETTEIFLDVFGDLSADYDGRLYAEGVDAYLDVITAHEGPASLMIVGHNPMIEELASMLITEGPQPDELAYGYPTAGLLALDFDAADGSGVAGRVAGLIVPALN